MADNTPESSANCCGGSDQENAAGCGCGSTPKRRSRLRMVLFVTIMLAAVGVGAYSFWAKSAAPACGAAQDCSGSGGCCPSAGK
ncbi:MAG TPA: hypothetical protein VGL38_07560 [bacterium]